MAVDCGALALVSNPEVNAPTPVALEEMPKAVEESPLDTVLLPNAVEARPLAIVLNPPAKLHVPILATSQCVPSVVPALNALFCDNHIIRVPAPLTGKLNEPGLPSTV